MSGTLPAGDAAVRARFGDAEAHDIMMSNRLTAGLWVAANVVVPRGSHVVGFSPTYSHPAVQRAVSDAGATFTDLTDMAELKAALAADPKPGALFLTRLAVSYQILDEADLRAAVVEVANPVEHLREDELQVRARRLYCALDDV